MSRGFNCSTVMQLFMSIKPTGSGHNISAVRTSTFVVGDEEASAGILRKKKSIFNSSNNVKPAPPVKHFSFNGIQNSEDMRKSTKLRNTNSLAVPMVSEINCTGYGR